MPKLFSASLLAFYDTEVHGARFVDVRDPDWVRPTIEVPDPDWQPPMIDVADLSVDAPLINDEPDPDWVRPTISVPDDTALHPTIEIPDVNAMAPMVSVANEQCLLPEDAFEISDALHASVMAELCCGNNRVLGKDGDGMPVAVDPAPPSADELWNSVRRERDVRIAAVTWRLERHARELRQDVSPTDDVVALDTYIQALADIPQTQLDPANIIWPVL
tara:strand:- start:4614 stop:5267 length:654 start_codon:yes stop_codon:yes gene_type:complete